MSNAAASHPRISKSALARLLGCAEDDLLSREDAAVEIGRSEGTLANIAKFGPPFYCSTAGPTGGEVWYPRSEVIAYRDHIDAKIKSSWRGRTGRQHWSHLQNEANKVSLHTVVSMIESWKVSELYRRAQAILNDPSPINGRDRCEEECRLLGFGLQGDRLALLEALDDGDTVETQRKAIFSSLDDEAEVTEKHLLALAASHGIAMSRGHPSFDALIGMLQSAWIEVLEAEMRWRNFKFTGMPDRKPMPMCEVQISASFKRT